MGVDEFTQLSTTIGVTAATILYILFNMVKGRQERRDAPAEKPVSHAEWESVTAALADLREELAEFTKEVRNAMVAHGERIAKSEARLEERKR